MASRKSVIDEQGEVADLSALRRNALKPFSTLPASLQAKLSGRKRREAALKDGPDRHKTG